MDTNTPVLEHGEQVPGRRTLQCQPAPRTTALAPFGPAQLRERSTISRNGTGQPHVDAFRTLRTRLLAATSDAPSSTILVAPVSRGSGGSFVARNLAAAFAFDEAMRALLVDCDLLQASQHATLRLDPINGGLVNYLEGPAVPVSDLLYETGIPRLQLLPAGTANGSSAEYLSSFRMQLLMDALRGRTPPLHVLLDSPPVADSPDARILAGLADMVVLVAGYGRDSPDAISRAAAEFDPGKFAGVVFNEGP